jgi:hypothetical protein
MHRQYFTTEETIKELEGIMWTKKETVTRLCVLLMLACSFCVGTAGADGAKPAYPVKAPDGEYRMSMPEEIAMSRSAAPPSISGDATILILGDHGYDTAAKGRSGFVCLVERSWGAGLDDAEFWNPKIRGPICFNPAAARSVLPAYLKRTELVFAGISRLELIDRSKADPAANRIIPPEAGAMSFMLSKQQNLGDSAGHWHPHLMFFDRSDEVDWGANLNGSPIMAARGVPDPFTTFFVSVPAWSDGTPVAMSKH